MNFFLLLRCDILKLFRGNGKKSGGKAVLAGSMLVVFGILIVTMSVLYTAIFASVLPDEYKYFSLSIVFAVFSLIILFSTVGTSKILFGASDYDMLISMPIRPRDIILSKLAYVYIIDLLMSLACVLPASITYMLIAKSGAITLLNAILILPFMPLLPLVIGLIIGTVVNVITAKIKRKSLVGVIFGLIFILAYLAFVFFAGTSEMEDEQMTQFLLGVVNKFGLFNFISKAVCGNFLNLVIFALVGLFIASVYVWVLSVNYKKINGLITAKASSASYNLKKQKKNSVIGTLIKKEVKHFFSNSSIVMNSLVGPLLAVLLGVTFLVNGGIETLLVPEELGENAQMIITTVKSIFPFMPCLTLGIANYTAFSVSLEGKNLWFIKSLPISAKNWLFAKIALSLIISLPCGIISVVLLGISMQVQWYDYFIAVILLTAYLLTDSLLGIAVNLKFPQFNWANPAEIVKRGTSMTICMIAGILFVIPVFVLQFAFSVFLSPYLGYLAILIILLALAFLFYTLAFSKAEQKLLKF